MDKSYFIPIIFGIIDLIFTYLVYLKVKKSTNDFELFKFKKLIFILPILIVITYHLNLGGLSLILSIILGIYPITTILAYPQEFRNFLDDYKNKTRVVSKGNVSRLISEKGLEEVVDTIISLYRQKLGSSIIITRQDYLEDVEKSGYDLGETEILSDVLTLFFTNNSKLNKGAIVIRDNKIVGANCKMPIVYNEQLQRSGAGNKHFGMFGIVTTTDAVVVGTSGDSGYITIGGTRPDGTAYFRFLVKMQEHDIQNGITKGELLKILNILLKGVGNPEDYKQEQEKIEEKERLLQEKAQQKIERAKNVKTKEQKMAEREERRNSKK